MFCLTGTRTAMHHKHRREPGNQKKITQLPNPLLSKPNKPSKPKEPSRASKPANKRAKQTKQIKQTWQTSKPAYQTN
jgi:hypothetical protein